MKASGNIRKMRTELGDVVAYTLPLFDVLTEKELVPMNQFIGNTISIRFDGTIHCVVSGEKIKKAYGEGMSYQAFRTAPQAVESIIRPELCQAHLGVGLRDLAWEVERHAKPHYVYLSLTSGIKVGVTRKTQIPTRWIDQGAVQALLLAETPYRQAAGLIEVALKSYVTDKTNWRNMLKNEFTHTSSLKEEKKRLREYIPDELRQYYIEDSALTAIEYPVIDYPSKVTSLKLDKMPEITKKLTGIKGQYLIFDDNTVLNLRSHSGYQITFDA